MKDLIYNLISVVNRLVNCASSSKYQNLAYIVCEIEASHISGSLENGNTPKRGVRSTANDNERHEYNVEKIVGKRFNTRKHMWEYEVKWENYEQ